MCYIWMPPLRQSIDPTCCFDISAVIGQTENPSFADKALVGLCVNASMLHEWHACCAPTCILTAMLGSLVSYSDSHEIDAKWHSTSLFF